MIYVIVATRTGGFTRFEKIGFAAIPTREDSNSGVVFTVVWWLQWCGSYSGVVVTQACVEMSSHRKWQQLTEMAAAS